MRTMVEYTLGFSNAHWERHEKTTITMSLFKFEQLVTAAELLSEGRRLSTEQRRNWALISGSANAMLKVEYKRIQREVEA